jgi:primosomal protein N' (replication factor Y)
MQSVKPLRLKRETYRLGRIADSPNVAHVWVDTGLSHLDGLYTYRIPNDLLNSVVVGSRLKVPFNSRSCEAIVVELSTSTQSSGNLKVIESLLDHFPVTNSAMITFYSQMANYWASDPYSIIKSGIPVRVAAIEKTLNHPALKSSPGKSRNFKKTECAYFMHTPHISAYSELADLAIRRLKQGSVLLLLPDIKDVSRTFALLKELSVTCPVIRLDSSLSRSERYANYLEIMNLNQVIVIGTRSALFAPINGLDSIIVGLEKSEQYYEQKHPYWNVRDSAFLRSSIESTNLFFTGYVPSAEMAYQIEQRKVKFVSQRHSVKTLAYSQVKGELLPDRIIPEIRKALKLGPVLFLAPRKGYANALLCAKCKNIALCNCGGRLLMSSSTANPICSLCTSVEKDWKCKWCSSTSRYAAARGIERFYEEIGRAFPSTAIQLSNAPNILEEISAKTKIVIATPGAIPAVSGGYSSVVILEGQRFLASGSAIYEEMVYESFFDSASRVKESGSVLVVLDSSHPVIASITRWNPSVLIKKILRENSDALLPPYATSVLLKVSTAEAAILRNGLLKSINDGKLPSSSRVYLTENPSKNESRLLLNVPREYREDLAKFVHELTRKRAISKKSFISVALDPYALLP